ncbi:sodium:solute symporter family transporter [Haliscomenobacter hydrossis]|uniref:Na+/solute symporter n=1 Tax=Haliscomenobacter hydrossis (strain ATCC 27775 / DSM 1100 / LMG 10767 / O) TaxID=760192 RepID=F4L4R7_HALH1|nr:sodium:solute symporter [Haliscomenobacter hydrossis]AEE53015.1 Na+/solute symporter [Haliscomenobacter hydrossis DSM 1100]
MQDSSWFVATVGLLLAYTAVILFFVVRGALRTKSMADYAVGQGFSPYAVGLSLATATTSAATFIINPGFIALYGWSAFVGFGICMPAGLFLSQIVLTKSFRRYGKTVKALTMAQWIGQRYESKRFALFFAFLSLLLITFIVLICVGITKVLSQALGMSEFPVLTGMVVFVFSYMMFGGANSMVYTNTLQALIKLLVAVMLLLSGHEYLAKGVDSFWNQLAVISPSLSAFPNPASPLYRDFFEIVICNFVIGIAIVCQPHLITKSLLLRDDKDVNRYLWVGSLAQMTFFLVVFAGFYARFMFPDLTVDGTPLKMDGIMSAYVLREFSVWAGLIVILGLLSAGLSTLEALIQALSTTITSDIIKPLFGQLIKTERTYFMLNKVVIIGLAVIAIALSWQQLQHPKLSVGIFAQLGVYGFFSTAFVPVLFGIFLKDVPRWVVVMAALTAFVLHFGAYFGGISPYLQGTVRNPAVASTFGILGALGVGLLGYGLAIRRKN